MGLYIKGVEMPKDDMKDIMILADGRVFQFSGYGNPKPLGIAFPIPEPHGDLIDREAARKIIKPWSQEDERSGCTFDTVKKLMYTMLDRAPVIIEAEEVYGQCFDTAGNFHWYGTHSGEHIINAENE